MDSLSFISSDNQNINELTQTNNINSTLSLGSSVTSLASSSSSASAAFSSISTFLTQQGQSLYLPSTLTTIGNLTDSFLSDLLPITASVNNFVNGTLDNFSNAIIGTTIQPPYLLDIAVPAAAAAAAAAASITTIDTTITTTTTGTSVFVDAATSQPVLETEQLHHLQAIGVSVILLIVILGTVIGNVLVCVAVCLVRKLRRPCNYLLVSLAVSDLCVAILVMPTALIYEVLGKWTFGTVFCDVWVSFDVLSCTASILNLCAISVDRYWAITKPLEYGVKRTPRRMMMCVALVWLGAACISLPPLLILGNEHYTEDGVTPLCAVCQNFGYQIYATLGSFYIPLTVMLFVYYQIFRAARRIVMDEKRAQTRLETALNGGAQEKPIEPGGGGGGNLIPSPHQKKLRFQLAKERKASTTLGIIMSAFTVCWLPFFILALVRPFLKEDQGVPKTLSSLFLWLGYANSLLNPIIYATLNRDFRKPFQEILYFRCSNLNLMMREDFYHSQYGEPASQRVVLGGEGHGARESFL